MFIRIKQIISNKNNWPHIVILIVTIIFAVANFVSADERYTGKIVSMMQSLIAIEFFTLIVGKFEGISYKFGDISNNFDEISHKLDNVYNKFDNVYNQTNQKLMISGDNFISRFNEFAPSARHDIVVIGGSLSYLSPCRDIIQRISTNVESIKLLAVNLDNEGVREGYNKLIERQDGAAINLNHLRSFVGIDKVEIHSFDFLPTAYFFGMDIDQPNGRIGAMHLFKYGSIKEYPLVILTHLDGELYNTYRKQIDDLWRNSNEWRPT